MGRLSLICAVLGIERASHNHLILILTGVHYSPTPRHFVGTSEHLNISKRSWFFSDPFRTFWYQIYDDRTYRADIRLRLPNTCHWNFAIFLYDWAQPYGQNHAGDFPFYVNTFLIGSVNNYNTHKPTYTHIHTHLHPNCKMRSTKNNEIREK